MRKNNLKLTLVLLGIVMLTVTGCTSFVQDSKEQLRTEAVQADDENTVVTETEEGNPPDIQLDENVVRNRVGPEAVEYDASELKPQMDGDAVLYYFDSLSDTEQTVYQEVYLAIVNHEEAVVSTLDADLLDKVYQCVMFDHPEIFYSAGYVCTKHMKEDTLTSLTFYAKDELSEEEIAKRQQEIDAYTDACLNAMPQGLDQYGQVKYIYDYIIERTQYDLNAEDNQNIYSVFVNGASVCQGYAEATQYLLRKLGYAITTVTGKAEGGSHAWNLIQVDGAYYYLDTTWGDVDYQTTTGEDELLKNMPVNYDYFLITTSQLEKTHTIDSIVTMPACVSMEDNYYVREGRYFTQIEEQKLSECFQKAKEEGTESVTLKADSDAVFAQLKEYLLTEQRIFDYVDATDSVSYYEDSRMDTICFWLKR